MELVFTNHFKKDYKKLSVIIQKQTDRKLMFLIQDLSHPSLRIKKVRKYKDIFESSINMQYRFLFQIKKNELVLLRIGSHDILES